MRSRPAALLAALALIAGLLGLTAGPASAAGGGTVEGQLSDANGIGIPGVFANLLDLAGNDTGYVGLTDGSGYFTIDAVPEGTYLVRWGAPIDKFANDTTDITFATQWPVLDAQFTYVYDSISDYVVPPPSPNYQVRLQAPDGSPLSTCPDFFDANNPDDGPYGGDCTTDADGVTTGRMSPGSWLVKFRSDRPDLADTWYGTDGTRAGATPLTIPSDGSVADMGTVTMRPAGVISVTVRRADRKIPLGDGQVCVVAYVQRTQEYAGTGCTDGRGVALVGGLTAGKYTLWANPSGQNNLDFVPRWLGDLKTQDKSPLVTATIGSTVNAGTITLPSSGRIAGTIRDKKTGKPLSGFCAVVGDYSFIGGEDNTRTLSSTSCTGADGTYVIRGLDSGTYKVTVVPSVVGGSGTQGYAVGYYGGTTYSTAKAVNVSLARTTSKIDVGLMPQATISGSVVDSSGAPVFNALVFGVDAASGKSVGYTFTTPDSNSFTMDGLPATKVLLQFSRDGFPPVWWDGTANGTTSKAAAKPITTTVGGAVALAPITLQ